MVALCVGMFVGCFTGDGLLDQPCRSDDDCNAVADAFGRRISCADGVCGAVCGDGLRVAAVEECDDSNDIDTDACVGCKLAVCGDDVTHAGVEECDDGNTIDNDACTGCKLATCGDGVVWIGEEECDDDNDIDTDACAGCRTVACGDGRVNPATELCDDHNRANDDGCDAQCRFGAESVASGLGDHSCALRAGGLRCWGANDVGQLGYGSIALVGDEPSDMPPQDIELASPVLAVALGTWHTCALLDDDNVHCWGDNAAGQLGLPGLGPIGDERDEPLEPSVNLGGAAVELTAGARHTCARLADHAVRCWGDNTYGQLGYPKLPNIGIDDDPASHPPLALPPTRQLSAGGLHTCALLADDLSVRCWGRNFSFQLGVETPGTVLSDPSAAQPVALDGQAAAVSAGGSHTCVILAADGSVRCWGGNDHKQVGHDEVLNDDVDNPTAKVGAVDLEGRRAEQIQAGASHTCAVVEGGAVWCWGRVLAGGAESGTPPARMPLEGLARHAAVGSLHTCVRFDGGVVRCWGNNQSGQLGLGNTIDLGASPGDWPPPAVRLYPTLDPEQGA